MAKAKRGAVPGMLARALTAWEQYRPVFDEALRWTMATPPEDRLRWLLRFAAEDLDALSPQERIERGAKLEWFQVKNSASAPVAGPMPDAGLRRLHVEINRGLRAVLGEGNESWSVPGPAQLDFYRSTPRFKKGPKGAETAPKRTIFNIRWDWGEHQHDAGILAGVIHLLKDAGSRLRGCKEKECGRAFLAVKRQVYCGEDCSQRARDRRKQEAEAEQGRAKR